MEDVLDGKSGGRREERVKAGEYASLQLRILEHRFDDQVAVGVVVKPVHGAEIVSRQLGQFGAPEASGDSAFDEPVQTFERLVRLSALLIRKDRRMASQREHQRDFRPHHSGADDANFFKQPQFMAPSIKNAAQQATERSLA